MIAGERLDDLERSARISLTLGRAGFTDGSVRTESLSGGWKRRLAIARSWRCSPTCFWTSPPITWISKAFCGWKNYSLAGSFASVVVSHDRYFLDNVVNDMAKSTVFIPKGCSASRADTASFWRRRKRSFGAIHAPEALANRVRRGWMLRRAKAHREISPDGQRRPVDSLAPIWISVPRKA